MSSSKQGGGGGGGGSPNHPLRHKAKVDGSLRLMAAKDAKPMPKKEDPKPNAVDPIWGRTSLREASSRGHPAPIPASISGATPDSKPETQDSSRQKQNSNSKTPTQNSHSRTPTQDSDNVKMSSSTPRTVKLQKKPPVKKVKLQPKSEGSGSSSGKTVKLRHKKPVKTVKLVKKSAPSPSKEGQSSGQSSSKK